MHTQAAEAPGALQELVSSINSLRERMKRGEPDMMADEFQAAIEKAEEKCRDLQEQMAGTALSGRAPSIYRAVASRNTSAARDAMTELVSLALLDTTQVSSIRRRPRRRRRASPA